MSGIEQLISDYINQELNDLITANIENSNGRQESEEIDNVVETAVTTATPTTTTTTTTATTSEISNEDDQIADSGVTDETQSTQIESTTDDDSINEIINEKPSINNVETNQESVVATTTTATPVRNRELKSILALSKEAKLDTNLTHRRKTIDTTPTTTTTTKRDTMSPKKLLKTTNFPVTAESELDLYENNDNEKLNNDRLSKKVGRKRKQSDDVVSSSNSGLEGAAEMRKNPGLLNLTPLKPNKDVFCWRCHRDGVNVVCETCPRAYHYKCLKQIITDTEHWPCPECVSILKAENTQTRSKAMKGMTLDHLCNLLKYAVKRMIQCDGSEPFIHPVDEKLFPEYRSYIIQPMDLTMLDKNIKNNLYGSTQAFEADAKWILHNCIIFNSYQSKLTTTAKTILKICKQEMAEIENCPSCYLNANTKKHTWFVEVCPKPHLLVWAKLKGFPYWPAKMMSFNTTGMVDVRFFGAHDKAWVSTKDCYLYSLKDPNSGKQKRNDIIECVKELEIYVENLKSIYGKVVYAPFKTPIEAGNEEKYLKSFLPTYYDVVNKNKKDEEIKEEIEKKIETTDTKSQQDSPDRNLEDTENSSENTPKQIPKTRIEYRYSSGNKPRWVVKPLKNVEIKKRQSSDNIGDSPKKRCDDKVINENEIETSPPTTEQQEQAGQEPETQPQRKSPPIKFKISDQLIRKLGDITKEIYHKKNKQIDQNESHKMEIDKSMDPPVEQSKEFEKEIEKTDKLDGEKSEQIDQTVNSIIENEEKSEETGDESEKIDLDIDENNIRNIIHSSLVKNNESSNTDNVPEKVDEKKIELKTRKRKRLENDRNESPPEKLVKLTPPIDATANIDETTQQKEDKILINEDTVKEKETNNNEDVSGTVVEIKNEAESEEEQDVEYMEAKRQYMSALNISEKQKLPIKPKANEIRTRSKTEEKRTKTNNDQLNKIVDNNRTSDSSCSDIESNRKLLLNENNNINKDEIYIKSLTKMQTTKHKARKSFPTPNYNKRNIKILPKPLDRSKVLSNSNIQIKSCNTTTLPKLHYSKANIEVDNAIQTRTNLPLPPLQPSVTITTNDRTINETQNESNNSSNLLINTSTITTNLDSSNQLDNELSVLKEILPENVTKSVNDILCQPPPKLKPKPFSLLNSSCESSVPSSAGPVTSRINSMTQTLNDCFRGLIVEVINDLGKSNNPEATISNLKLEIEELNYRHSLELSEIRRNVSIMLKDIQKCLIEERKRVINETKANCEIEATKRVEEAKSKQWCANCSKEAQFYCCWNTSYCDYVCQQKHWLKHMSKCTQVTATTTTSQNQSVITNRSTINQQTSNSGSSSGGSGSNTPRFRNVLSKPQKVYVKRSNTPYKGQSSNNHITLVESAPGNFEFIGNGSITVNGKILATTSVAEKIQNGNNVVTVSAPSSGTSVELTSANPITNNNNNNNNSNNNNNNNNKNNNDNEDNSNNKVTVTSKSPASKSNDANSSDSEQ